MQSSVRRLSTGLLATLLGFVTPATPVAVAEETAVVEEELAVQAWGGSHPDCAEWSDACVVCRRADGVAACSLPGPACLPVTTTCRAPAQAPAKP